MSDADELPTPQELINRNREAFAAEWLTADMPDDPLLKLRCENWFVRGIRVEAERMAGLMTEQVRRALLVYGWPVGQPVFDESTWNNPFCQHCMTSHPKGQHE